MPVPNLRNRGVKPPGILKKIIRDEPIIPEDGILHHEEGIDLMPANIELSGMEISLVNAKSREFTLKSYVSELKKNYDYILIDCMPSLGIREKEAVVAVQEGREPRVIRDFHPHTLRHTFATRCFENKMEPKVVQKLMGHSSISITLNIYTHVLDSKMDEEVKKFGVAKTQEEKDYSQIAVAKRTITAMSHC